MLMVFVGFNDAADAADYVARADAATLVAGRPYRTAKAYEWK